VESFINKVIYSAVIAGMTTKPESMGEVWRFVAAEEVLE
jgi:hypothetical protein